MRDLKRKFDFSSFIYNLTVQGKMSAEKYKITHKYGDYRTLLIFLTKLLTIIAADRDFGLLFKVLLSRQFSFRRRLAIGLTKICQISH